MNPGFPRISSVSGFTHNDVRSGFQAYRPGQAGSGQASAGEAASGAPTRSGAPDDRLHKEKEKFLQWGKRHCPEDALPQAEKTPATINRREQKAERKDHERMEAIQARAGIENAGLHAGPEQPDLPSLLAVNGRCSGRRSQEAALFDSRLETHPRLTAEGRKALEELLPVYKERLNAFYRWRADADAVSDILVTCANQGYLRAIGRCAYSKADSKDLLENWPRHQEMLAFLAQNNMLPDITWFRQGKGLPLLKDMVALRRLCSVGGEFRSDVLKEAARGNRWKLPSTTAIDKARAGYIARMEAAGQSEHPPGAKREASDS